MKNTVKEFASYEAYEAYTEAHEDLYTDHRAVAVHKNGWTCYDMQTSCKSWKTALRRFFSAIDPENVGVGFARFDLEYLFESCENGCFKDQTILDYAGRLTGFGWYSWSVEQLDDNLWYIFLNVKDEEYDETETVEADPAEPEEEPAPTVDAIRDEMNKKTPRSAWDKGVRAYADELLESVEEAIEGGWFDAENLAAPRLLERAMLNGAQDWTQYSEGGCALCYDGQIAERLCTPSELKKTRNGQKDPNPRENWIKCQARALFQASEAIKAAARAAFN